LIRSCPPELFKKEVGQLPHVLYETVKTGHRENTRSFPIRFTPSILWKERVRDTVSQLVERGNVGSHPFWDVVNTPDNLKLLKKENSVKNQMVERRTPFCPP